MEERKRGLAIAVGKVIAGASRAAGVGDVHSANATAAAEVTAKTAAKVQI